MTGSDIGRIQRLSEELQQALAQGVQQPSENNRRFERARPGQSP